MASWDRMVESMWETKGGRTPGNLKDVYGAPEEDDEEKKKKKNAWFAKIKSMLGYGDQSSEG